MAWQRHSRTQIPRVILCALLLAAVALGQAREQRVLQQYKQEITRRAQSLDSIKAQLEQGRSRLGKLREREASSLALLKQMERNITMAQEYLDALSSGIDTITVRIDTLGVQLVNEQGNLSARQQAMKRRLAGMYRVGTFTPADALLGFADPTEMLRRVFYFRRLKAYDQHLVTQISASKNRIEQDKSALELVKAEQVAMRAEKLAEQTRLLKEKSSRETVLEQVRSEREAFQAQMTQLEEAQQQLLVLIKQLESRRAAASIDYERSLSAKFEKRKGRLGWPVDGEIVGTFGKVIHPVYKTVTMNNGIDIVARPGVPVQCVASGIVAYIGRMRGLGRFIVVDHHGGFLTIYSNMGTVLVAQDAAVELGTIIGNAPMTAPAGGGSIVIHFEVRKSTEAMDPLLWLEKRGPR